MSWKYHFEELESKLDKSCYLIRLVKKFMSLEIVRLTYFSYVHSVPSYGIIFWGNSSYSKSFFKVQKVIIRVITNSCRRGSCSELFRQLNILPLQSEYIFSLLLFIIKNKDQFLASSEVQDINTRYNSNLHLPLANLTLYQKGVFLMYKVGFIISCSQLSWTYQMTETFTIAVKRYILDNSFHNMEEYFNHG
jgi:hypothetical protein